MCNWRLGLSGLERRARKQASEGEVLAAVAVAGRGSLPSVPRAQVLEADPPDQELSICRVEATAARAGTVNTGWREPCSVVSLRFIPNAPNP